MTATTYTYKRKDGGTTDCYGELLEDSNIEVICENENYDRVYTDNVCKTWKALCMFLEDNYNNHIEEMVAV